LTHVSLGGHYFESTDTNGFIQNVVNMVKVIEANLTERCDTETCNGFCDGKNRCTCPMCCENDCYYTYCDTTSGTCMPWPKANPKMKIICNNTDKCKNTYHCLDGYGCVIKEYAEGCKPASKCNVTKCDSVTGKCKYVDMYKRYCSI
jgi:galactose-inhibitable lectin heavy subunit